MIDCGLITDDWSIFDWWFMIGRSSICGRAYLLRGCSKMRQVSPPPDAGKWFRIVSSYNISFSGKKHNFKKHSNSKIDSLGTKYDYISIMQYSKTAFGSGKVTMDPKLPGVFQLGQRVGFSDTDSIQANKLYRCEGEKLFKSSGPVSLNLVEWKAMFQLNTTAMTDCRRKGCITLRSVYGESAALCGMLSSVERNHKYSAHFVSFILICFADSLPVPLIIKIVNRRIIGRALSANSKKYIIKIFYTYL